MELTKKKLVKETLFWVIIIGVTAIITNMYTNQKPESKINESYSKVYDIYLEAEEISEIDITKVQEFLDEGRLEIKTIKEKFEISEELIKQFNSVSSEMDKLQEKIIKKAKDNIELIQIYHKENKDTSILKKETEEIIISLENGDSRRAKDAAENLKVILANVYNQ